MQPVSLALTAFLLRSIGLLPYWLVACVGYGIGSLLFLIPSRRKRIVLTNVALCFPSMSEAARLRLARDHFRHLIRSYLERGVLWFGSAKTIERLVEIDSRLPLTEIAKQPTIFLGFHFVGIEAGCMRYSLESDAASLYTRMSNTGLCGLAKQQRGRFGATMIERSSSAKDMLRSLRSGVPVMMAADMDHGIDSSVFAPFFGVQACTLTSVSRLAKLSGARVVPFVTEVLPRFKGYRLSVFEPFPNYPSGSDHTDAVTMNGFLETQIERIPCQYYWVHRRFKHRPEGEASVY